MSTPPPAAADPNTNTNHPSLPPTAAGNPSPRSLLLALGLLALTFVSTTYAGSFWISGTRAWFRDGLAYSVPLLAILLAHELGHYVAARLHGVAASPPFFVPIPLPPLGTMGAVILMPDRITRRNALFDIGAAGPLAGLCVALPVLIYGIAQSPIGEPNQQPFWQGQSLLFAALLHLIKGPLPAGREVLLTPSAFAGWAGLLVTMLNLLPAVQLDGGHVAYALFGERQARYSRLMRAALLPLAAGVSLLCGLPEYRAGVRGLELADAFTPGLQWFVCWCVLRVMVAVEGAEHPATDDAALSPKRRILARFMLLLFPLLFMPVWLRVLSAR